MSGGVPLSSKAKQERAQKLFEAFTGHDAQYIDEISVKEYDTAVGIGQCTGIMYETVRDGVKEQYIHEFKKMSQPILAVSWDGQQIILIGGSYLFKDSGINDI